MVAGRVHQVDGTGRQRVPYEDRVEDRRYHEEELPPGVGEADARERRRGGGEGPREQVSFHRA